MEIHAKRPQKDHAKKTAIDSGLLSLLSLTLFSGFRNFDHSTTLFETIAFFLVFRLL
ncbi:hypothetical protein HB762_10245 [Vibrio campbellii]|uniref:Uncharacterized protein n=1 Tax=Vibrio campbellii TaxID=680 RepID=A0ABY5ID91_9VIBR|nr:hypothetical protein [Vibrio campbellii]UTZ31746.1 hypothetical protein HB762_10245 [Vibrio campbellii]